MLIYFLFLISGAISNYHQMDDFSVEKGNYEYYVVAEIYQKHVSIDTLTCDKIKISILNVPSDSAIGLKYVSEVDNFYPRSLEVIENFVLIPDELNKRIIKVDLIHRKISFGSSMRYEMYATDIIAFDSIILIDHIGWILKFDNNLKYLEKERLSSSTGKFINSTNNYSDIYYGHSRELFRVSSDSSYLVSKGKYYNIFDNVHGKEHLLINEHLIEIENSKIYLKSCEYHKMFPEGNNIDYNKDWIVFITVEDEQLVVNFFKR